MAKKIAFYTRLIISYVLLEVVMICVMVAAYMSVTRLSQEEYANQVDAIVKNYYGFSAVAIIVIIALTTTTCIYMARTLRVNIKNINDATNRLAMGNTNVLAEKKMDDEFGSICDNINKVIESYREFADIAEVIANGDLTVEVIPRSDEDSMGYAMQKMVESNRHALSTINEGAYQVITSSSQVASASEALAQGSTEQASAIEEVTASIAEVAEKTRINADEANTAAELINKVTESIKTSNADMKEMVEAMAVINKSSESIAKIIKVIDDIAFQTNILALNAAVEAARAGDAGKGFAVVAEEVRNLAAKSAQAAVETAELIEDSITKVHEGSKIATETYEALEVTTEEVKASGDIVMSIVESSNYQATAVAQINQAIGQISQVVQTNSATSEECAAASDEMSNQAVRMRELLEVYNLGVQNYQQTQAPRRAAVSVNPNERIISLGEDFGKY